MTANRKKSPHPQNTLAALHKVPKGEEAAAVYLQTPEGKLATGYLDHLKEVTAHPDGWRGYMAEQAARRARDGDTEAARVVLDDFVGAVTQRSARTWNGPIWFEHARFIADAFERILAGADPAIALGIKRSAAGRRKSKYTESQREAFAAGYELLMRKGLTEKQAMDEMDSQVTPRRNVQRARAENNFMKYQDLEVLKVMVKPIAPQIGKIIDAHRRR